MNDKIYRNKIRKLSRWTLIYGWTLVIAGIFLILTGFINDLPLYCFLGSMYEIIAYGSFNSAKKLIKE
jgi:uncharacterized membrane protein HdeD (DUF308 family)